MRKDYVMGNSAIAAGALCSGVKLVAGYPGTPSTEIIESIFHAPHDGVHLEWSVNEKADKQQVQLLRRALNGDHETGRT